MITIQERKLKLKNAIKSFKSSNQDVDDFMELFQSTSMALRQGNGLIWSDIQSILEELEPKEFKCMYPTFESYMNQVDVILENKVGIGHEHCVDYMWISAYEDKIPPNDTVYDFLYEWLK